MKRLLGLAIAAVALCALVQIPAAHAVGTSHMPGVFAVAIKGQLPGSNPATRRQMGRLALYNFSSTGTVTERFWAWNTSADTPRSAWAGTTADPNFCITYVGGTAPDRATAPLCRTDFHDKISTLGILEGEPKTLSGTYVNVTRPGEQPLDGDLFKVTWANGAGVEHWRYMWSTATFAKIEMVSFDKFDNPGDFVAAYSAPAQRAAAVNAGWGWGAAGTTFKGGRTTAEIAALGQNYKGCNKFWNNFYTDPNLRNNPTGCPDILGLATYTLTNATYPKLRLFTFDDRAPGGSCSTNPPSDVYRYFSALDQNTQVQSVTDRRVQSVVEHDFDCDQVISDNAGHTQMGLQIIDSAGAFIGVVMIQSQYNGNPTLYDSIGASYYTRTDITNADPTFVVSP